VGYSKSNTSPILKLFLSRLDELVRGEPEALTPRMLNVAERLR